MNQQSIPVFFIIGVQRSGSTLLSVILNNHSQVYVNRKPLVPLVASLYSDLKLDYIADENTTTQKVNERFVQHVKKHRVLKRYAPLLQDGSIKENIHHICQTITTEQQKQIYGDKCLSIADDIPQLAMIFPKARFIHLVRDGRAVAKSIRDRAYSDLCIGINEWKREIVRTRILREMLDESQFMEVCYEDILQQPKDSFEKICSFLNIPFEPTMLEIANSKATNTKNAYVKKHIDTDNVEKWRNGLSKKEIYKLEHIAGDVLLDLNYAVDNSFDSYKTLSPFKETWLEFKVILRYMMRSKVIVMDAQELVEWKIPFKERMNRGTSRIMDLLISRNLKLAFKKGRSIFNK